VEVRDRDPQQRLHLRDGAGGEDVLADAGDRLHGEAARLQPGQCGSEARPGHAELLLVLIRVEELVVERARRIVLAREVRRLAGRVPVLEADAEPINPSRGWSGPSGVSTAMLCRTLFPSTTVESATAAGSATRPASTTSEAADIARCIEPP